MGSLTSLQFLLLNNNALTSLPASLGSLALYTLCASHAQQRRRALPGCTAAPCYAPRSEGTEGGLSRSDPRADWLGGRWQVGGRKQAV